VFRIAAWCGVTLAGLIAGGCSRSTEAKITGSSSAPPIPIQCAWLPGHTYHLRLEMTQITDSQKPEPNERNQHRVTFDQECLVKVTEGARSGLLNLDMEILALGMERGKGGQKTLSFDSDQGGETMDEQGYIPVLKKMIGGRLRFQVSSNGNVLRAEGISEWVERALRAAAAEAKGKAAAFVPVDSTEEAPPPSPTVRTTIRNADGSVVTTSRVSSSSTSGGTVGSTLRKFFTQDHFRQMLEFPFLPPNPVRVGDRWPTQGDTPITTRGRFRYDASGHFAGYQMHRGTNCIRVEVEGSLAKGVAVGPKQAAKEKTLRATLWIDRELQFPVTAMLFKETLVPDSSTRTVGTNQVVTTLPAKVVQQHVATMLLSAKPTDKEAPAESASVK